jgi:hypothetical protein
LRANEGIHLTSICYSKFAEQLRNTIKAKIVLCRLLSGKAAAMLFVIFGAAAGAVLALRRYTVFALVPVSVLFAAAAIVTGSGHDPRTIVVEILGAVASPQFGYLAASSAAAYLRATRSSKLLQSMQAAIRQELGTAFEVPRSLPPELAILLTKLQHA